ncbi:MAG: hypothetical protein U0531_06400 [Dehalococcoidia bacterium]
MAAIELNISCPNFELGGMEYGVDPDAAAEVTAVALRATCWDRRDAERHRHRLHRPRRRGCGRGRLRRQRSWG